MPKKKNEKQKDQNVFKYDCKCVFQEMWELQDEGDSPHQTVMIMCELK